MPVCSDRFSISGVRPQTVPKLMFALAWLMLGRGNKGSKLSFVDDHIKNDDWLEEALATDSDNEAPSRTSAAGTNKDTSNKSDKSKTAVTEGGDRDG